MSSNALTNNVQMKIKEIILPFSLLPEKYSKDILNELKLPYFSNLISKAKFNCKSQIDLYSFFLPYEKRLFKINENNSPKISYDFMENFKINKKNGYWFILQPVHFHLASDHAVLTDYRNLKLDEETSIKFFNLASPIFKENQFDLVYGNSYFWFFRADKFKNLKTCCPDVACGKNIDIWMPKGEHEFEWLKLHNQIQMVWHNCVSNEERELQGKDKLNGVWIWGGSNKKNLSINLPNLIKNIYFINSNNTFHKTNDEFCFINNLIPYAISENWSGWIKEMRNLDNFFFKKLQNDLNSGEIHKLKFILSDNYRLAEWTLNRINIKKFWIKPSLKKLQ
tara:strand:- start:200 stop:1210 length:1011 start_codon:yes stop_codon:yes gene_type:complete